MLETGIKAPGFELPDQNGKIHALDEYRGRKVILYFYPKDNTAGCTKQACGFAELYPQFTEKGAVIIGVSKDSVASHKKFEEKFNLPFTLLSDTELSCITAYDVWKEKTNYGKKTMGVVRTTYLIDENGIIIAANDMVYKFLKLNLNDRLEGKHIYNVVKGTKMIKAMEKDGGDIELIDIKNKTIFVKLRGKCSGCKNSMMTLTNFVEQTLKNSLGNDITVVEVN